MNSAFIGFGSNVGDRRKQIAQGLQLLQEQCTIVSLSSLYETEPMYKKDQDWFLNGVVKVETELGVDALLELLLSIESQLGRVRSEKYGPRPLDLDILFFNTEVIDQQDLTVPHPHLHDRLFVLEPLCDVDSEFVHPVLNKTLRTLKEELNASEEVKNVGSLVLDN